MVLIRVYVISNSENDNKYVGTTTKSIDERMRCHNKDSRKTAKRNTKFYTAINEIGFDKFTIDLLEEFQVDNKYCDERWVKEGYYQHKYDCFANGYNDVENMAKGERARRKKEYCQKWYNENQEHIRNYREQNKERNKKQRSEYYKNNNELIKERTNVRNKKRVVCERCGADLCRAYLPKHIRLKHNTTE